MEILIKISKKYPSVEEVDKLTDEKQTETDKLEIVETTTVASIEKIIISSEICGQKLKYEN